MVFCVPFNVNVFVEVCCAHMFTLAIMASMPFFVYRSYWLSTLTLLMWFAYSSPHWSRLRQVNKAPTQAPARVRPACKHWYTWKRIHMLAHTHRGGSCLSKDKWALAFAKEIEILSFISAQIFTDSSAWFPWQGSSTAVGGSCQLPLFYFGPEAHGKAISRPFPVSLRKQCQWFVNRCNVAKSIFKIACVCTQQLIICFVCLVFVSVCRTEDGFSRDSLWNHQSNVV